MTIPNFDAKYGDLTAIQSDPRFMRLCTQQIQELSAMTSKHAQERVRLAIAISKEERRSTTRPEPFISRPTSIDTSVE